MRSGRYSAFKLAFDHHPYQVVVDELHVLAGGGHQAGGSHFVDLAGDALAVFVDHTYGGVGEDLSRRPPPSTLLQNCVALGRS